jgi:acyl-CoA synthetase (AMP-forming)/AMP-acid ligase II
MAGYWEKPEKTAEATADGWLHSGDVGEMSEDGYLTMRGRVKELLNVGGETWFPRDVEEALMLVEGIREAAVIGLDQADGSHKPVAFVTGEDIDTEAAIAAIEGKTPYTLTGLTVRAIGEFPMTPTGKIAKATLKAQAMEAA